MTVMDLSEIDAAPTEQSDQPVTVRLASADDVALLHGMVLELARYQSEEHYVTATEADLLRDGFGDNPAFESLIAEIDGRAVGMVIFHDTYSTWSGGRGFFIEDLFVDETVRGAGVGVRLIREMARLAHARKRTHLQLNVIHANPARHFYNRIGFTHFDGLLTFQLNDKAFSELAVSDQE